MPTIPILNAMGKATFIAMTLGLAACGAHRQDEALSYPPPFSLWVTRGQQIFEWDDTPIQANDILHVQVTSAYLGTVLLSQSNAIGELETIIESPVHGDALIPVKLGVTEVKPNASTILVGTLSYLTGEGRQSVTKSFWVSGARGFFKIPL